MNIQLLFISAIICRSFLFQPSWSEVAILVALITWTIITEAKAFSSKRMRLQNARIRKQQKALQKVSYDVDSVRTALTGVKLQQGFKTFNQKQP